MTLEGEKKTSDPVSCTSRSSGFYSGSKDQSYIEYENLSPSGNTWRRSTSSSTNHTSLDGNTALCDGHKLCVDSDDVEEFGYYSGYSNFPVVDSNFDDEHAFGSEM